MEEQVANASSTISFNAIDFAPRLSPSEVMTIVASASVIRSAKAFAEKTTYTYTQLHKEVCRFANALKAKGIKKGDRICIYMPMIPELAIAVLACARIGAIH